MVDVASSLYHARFSTRWHLAGEPVPRVYWFFPWKKKKKMFSGWHTRATGCRDIALNSRVMETGNRSSGGGRGEGGWFFRMDRGGWLDYGVLSGIFWMIGFASVVIPWVMNWFLMMKHGLNGWIFEWTILKNTV